MAGKYAVEFGGYFGATLALCIQLMNQVQWQYEWLITNEKAIHKILQRPSVGL